MFNNYKNKEKKSNDEIIGKNLVKESISKITNISRVSELKNNLLLNKKNENREGKKDKIDDLLKNDKFFETLLDKYGESKNKK